jgi:hypothetical protein
MCPAADVGQVCPSGPTPRSLVSVVDDDVFT